MEYTELIRLGLNKNEAKVFIALMRLGDATAGDLIKKTGFHRNIVYDNLEKLAEKALISSVVKKGVRHYILSLPEAICEYVGMEKKKIEEKEKIAEKISKEITKQIKRTKIRPKTQLLQGTFGVREIMNDTLRGGKDYIVFGSPGESVALMEEYFWRNYELKRYKKKMKVRMIFNEELREFGESIAHPLTEIKYLPRRFSGLTETTVYGNKVAITVWTEKPVITLIEDENVANAYKKYFEVLWKIAKR